MTFKLFTSPEDIKHYQHITGECSTDVFDVVSADGVKLEYEVNQALFIREGRLTNEAVGEKVATVTKPPSPANPTLGFIKWKQ